MTTRTYRALLVANSTFPSDPHNLTDLEGPRNDPALLRDALCDRDVGLVPSDNVRLVTERTMSEVLRELEDFLRAATRQDTLILYYSGHGLLDQSNELFLCTRDTRSDRLRSTAVKASDVRQMIDESAAATTVILLDCCHSGRFKSGADLPATLAGRGRFVVTSSRGGELANDTNQRNHASLFTHHLVEGLKHGAVDRDHDGIVNLSELYDYVHTALTEAGRQVPQKRFEGDGDVPIALRTMSSAANPQPGLLDPVLVQPELDVPDSVIDLGEVDPDEQLPPERIAVVNRGGGTLQWTVESSAEWCVAEPEDGAVMLRLSPEPGPNRANVYIRDAITGAIKTVRVTVRVRPPQAATRPPVGASVPVRPMPAAPSTPPPAADEGPVTSPPPETFLGAPVVAALEPAPAGPTEPPPQPPLTPDYFLGTAAAASSARSREAWSRWLSLVAATLAAVSGVLLLISGLEASEGLYNYTGYENILRSDKAPGLLPVLLCAGALLVAGVLAFFPRFTSPALGAALAVAVPAGFERLREHAAATYSCACVGPDDGVSFYRGAAILCLVAAIVIALALLARGAWTGRRWLPTSTLVVGAVTVVIWGWTSLLNLYEYYEEPFGSYGYFGGTGWHIAAIASVVGGFIAAAYVLPTVGRAMVIGAIALPVFAALTELIYVITIINDDGYVILGAVPAVICAGVLITVAVRVILRSRRADLGSGPGESTSLASPGE